MTEEQKDHVQDVLASYYITSLFEFLDATSEAMKESHRKRRDDILTAFTYAGGDAIWLVTRTTDIVNRDEN